jgi:hypothetical protein
LLRLVVAMVAVAMVAVAMMAVAMMAVAMVAVAKMVWSELIEHEKKRHKRDVAASKDASCPPTDEWYEHWRGGRVHPIMTTFEPSDSKRKRMLASNRGNQSNARMHTHARTLARWAKQSAHGHA